MVRFRNEYRSFYFVFDDKVVVVDVVVIVAVAVLFFSCARFLLVASIGIWVNYFHIRSIVYLKWFSPIKNTFAKWVREMLETEFVQLNSF